MSDPRTPLALPDDGEPERPSAARMYDAMLGGFNNYAVDRRAVEQAQAIYPDMVLVARANRAFLRRAVTYLLDQGVTQFLDIGAGIPTVGNTHEVARRRDPAARVAYVDCDPLAVAHSVALLGDTPHATAIQADAREPTAILADATTRRLLDFDRLVGVLLLAVLHFIIADEEVYAVVETLRGALAPGSFLAITHATYEEVPPDVLAQIERLYAGTTNPGRARSRAEIARFFTELDLVAPGLVPTPLWRPEAGGRTFRAEPARALAIAGVGRKP